MFNVLLCSGSLLSLSLGSLILASLAGSTLGLCLFSVSLSLSVTLQRQPQPERQQPSRRPSLPYAPRYPRR